MMLNVDGFLNVRFVKIKTLQKYTFLSVNNVIIVEA